MKLRRALAAAAATAAIGPAALLAAPHAYAEDAIASSTTGTTAETAGGTTTGGETTTGDETATGGENTGETTTGGTDTSGETTIGATDTSGETATSGENTGGTDTDGTDTGGAGDPEDPPTEQEPGDPSPPPYCEEFNDGYEEKALSVKLSGLPDKIVAGSGWKNFSLTVTNTSEVDLKWVLLYAEVGNFEDDQSKWLSQYIDLEYFNTNNKRWQFVYGATTGGATGGYFWAVDTLKPQEFVKADLRLNIHKDAPVGDGYTFGTGAHLDNVDGQECIAENAGVNYYFTILKPRSGVGTPGPSKPGKGHTSPKTKPQGEVEKLPVTGSLAETGASSALPTIATIGGVAMAVGAGAIVAVRRRKTADSGTAA